MPVQKEAGTLGMPWEQSYGYAQAVRVGDTIWVSGQLSHDNEGNIVGPAPHRDPLCRGPAVALPSIADRGRAHGGPVASAPYPEPKARPASPAHAFSQGALRPARLPGTVLTRSTSGQGLARIARPGCEVHA